MLHSTSGQFKIQYLQVYKEIRVLEQLIGQRKHENTIVINLAKAAGTVIGLKGRDYRN